MSAMLSRRGLVTAATLIMLGNVFSRLLGLVREQVIAALFGNSAATSSYVAASTVPTMVFDLLIGGALTAALIPVFSDYASGDKDKSLWKLASTVMALGGAALAVLTAVLVVFAQPLMSVLAAGLPEGDQQTGVMLLRVAMPSVVLLGLSGVTTALLYSRQVFVYPAFCVAGFNAGIIIAAVLFAGVLDTTSLVIGTVFGSFLQLVLQAPGLRRLGFRFSLDWRHPGLRRILVLYAPVAAGLVVSQIGVIIDRNLASQTGDDSLAVMRWATTLIQLPVGLVAVAISYAILPSLSRSASSAAEAVKKLAAAGLGAVAPEAERSMRDFKATLVMGIRLALLVMIPVTVALVLLRVPVVQLLFERGAFNAEGTERTALAFLCYAPQLPFLPVDYLLIFAFYARKNTITPVLVGVLGVLLYLATAFSLKESMGMPGLAIANAVQNSVHAIVLFALFVRVAGSFRGLGLWWGLGKMALAGGAMGGALWLVVPWLEGLWGLASAGSQAGVISAAALVGLLVYLLAVSLLRVEEMAALRSILARRALALKR